MQVTLTDLEFENNWVADHESYYDDFQSNALLIQDLPGILYMNTITFSGNKGVSTSVMADITGEGLRSGLLVFKNVYLSSLTFKAITFTENNLYYSKSNAQVVMPRLFSLTYAQLDEDLSVSFETLVIDDTNAVNGDCAVYINLHQLTINGFEIT